MAYYFVLGFFVGGVVTVILLKGLVYYCRITMEEANRIYSKAIKLMNEALEINNEALEIREEALESSRLVQQDIKDFKKKYLQET